MAHIVKLPHGGKITFFTGTVTKQVGSRAETLVRTVAQATENRVKELMTDSPRGGRIYRVGKTPTKADKAAGRKFRSHRASAPGEPPAVNTGRLRSSVVHAVSRLLPLGWIGRVGSKVTYARPLERGVKGTPGPAALKAGTARPGWRLAPRPAFVPALKWAWLRALARFKKG